MNSIEYAKLLDGIKARVRAARLRAVTAVNSELVLLYWHVGRDILQRQTDQGWGAKVVDRLSADLIREFPELRGFSPRNLNYMLAFARAWSEEPILQVTLAKLTWCQNITLLERLDTAAEREWYARRSIENGWSRPVLVHQIESGLYGRQGKALTNFNRTLPPEQSDRAREMLKDPYDLEFLYRLRCFVVVELKSGAFRPEHAGKMNFYLEALDDLKRHPEDRPSIGMILCRSKNSVVVEYSLRAAGKPIGVASYTLSKELPRNLKGALPAPEELKSILRSRGRPQEP